MKSWKQWITAILSLACVCTMAFGAAACQDKNKGDGESGSSQSSSSESSSVEEGPNGTVDNPFIFLPDVEKGYMEVTLPASASHYYEIARPQGRTFVVEGTDVQLQYTVDNRTETLTPTAGKIEVELGEADNTFQVVKVLLVNTKGAENQIKLSLPVPLGSEPDAAIAVELNAETTAKVNGVYTVYYTWTATATGTLRISSTHAKATLSMYNQNTYVSTSDEDFTLAVSEGDSIAIQVSVQDGEQGVVVDVPFTITMA